MSAAITLPVLVSGASGFVGQALLRQLQQSSVPVKVLSRPAHDLLLPASLSTVCDGIDTVFHLAACAHVNHAQTRHLYAVNVAGTQHLLSAAIKAGVRHFVYVSSILADPAFDRPRTAYGDSKWQAEQLLINAHERGDIAVSIVRPVNVYGPGMKGNLMTLMRLIRKGLLPPLPRFDHAFSLIGVEDLCAALICVAQQTPSSKAPVYVLSDGESYHIKTLEYEMRQAFGRSQPGWATPRQLFFVMALMLEIAGRLLPLNNAPGLRSYRALARNYTADSAASLAQLGYNPRSTFYNTLPQIVATMDQ
ncbi:NAD-dependent epimerase/dehydratase family protein [Gammaproteobacteria bacterium LSUCC0112]|nr:NAD-dependent epimerase/dehydratase family protein [Gammaproteobacteria bacterium LSUCC0112]